MARSTVIKAQSLERTEPLGLRSFRIDDVLREAHARIESAQREADAIRAEARAEAERIRAAAHEQGYRAGFDEGAKQGCETGREEARAVAQREFAAQQSLLVTACEAMIGEIQAGRASWEASARQDLIDLAMAIARRVVHHVGQRDHDVVLANLEEAVRLAGLRSDVTILVNPKEAETARIFAQSLLDVNENGSGVRVAAETEISPGGCRLQWGSGAIDSTLETQLDRIAEALGCPPEAQSP